MPALDVALRRVRQLLLHSFALGNVLNYGDEIVDAAVRLSHAQPTAGFTSFLPRLVQAGSE